MRAPFPDPAPALVSGDREVAALLAALDSHDLAARRTALAALRESGDPAAIPALIRLAGEPSSLATAAGEALFSFHSLTAIVPLAAGLEAPAPASRLAVVRALGDFRSPVVERLLARTLAEDPEPEVRREVIGLAGQWRHPTALPVLARALRDPDAEVRVRAVAALSRFAPGAGVAELVSALGDADWRVRRDVVLALGRYVVPAALGALVLALGDPDRRVVRDALGSLATLRAPYSKRYAELTGIRRPRCATPWPGRSASRRTSGRRRCSPCCKTTATNRCAPPPTPRWRCSTTPARSGRNGRLPRWCGGRLA